MTLSLFLLKSQNLLVFLATYVVHCLFASLFVSDGSAMTFPCGRPVCGCDHAAAAAAVDVTEACSVAETPDSGHAEFRDTRP